MKIFTRLPVLPRLRPDGTYMLLWPVSGPVGSEPGATAGSRCAAPVPDPEAMVRALESSGRFRRDTGLGAIYHRGKASYRELSPTNSVHIVVDGNCLSVHVDRISPLKRRPDGSVRYSLGRVVAHNVSGIADDVTRRLIGRRQR